MTVLLGAVLLVLSLLLVASGFVISSLLTRLANTNQAVLDQAIRTLALAETTAKAEPRRFERMMSSLAESTTQMHKSLSDAVSVVFSPPAPTLGSQGATNTPYNGPVMESIKESGEDVAPWDHTDDFVTGEIGVPDPRNVDPGYEFEADPNYDSNNPFGIPGLSTPFLPNFETPTVEVA